MRKNTVKKNTRKRNNRTDKSALHNWTSRGTIASKVLIGVVILASIYLVGGAAPKYQQTVRPENQPRAIPVDDGRLVNKDSLQLKTMKFKTCSEIAAVDILVDESGSMGFGTKLPGLQEALTAFADKLSEQSLIGLVSFNETYNPKTQIDTIAKNRSDYDTAVKSFVPKGGTYTRSAFIKTKERLAQAINKHKDKKFTLIFFSDGIPERGYTQTSTCCPHPKPQFPGQQRCFSVNEDPTVPTNIAEEIKNMGVKIYSIALLDKADQCFSKELDALMKEVASPGSYRSTYEPSHLKAIYESIVFETCENLQ